MYKLSFLIKLTLVSLIALFLVNNANGQIEFEKGYFIDNEDIQTECFIRNMAWDSNPTEFNYKLELTGNAETVTIQNVKEFSIYNEIKYIRADVEIDKSSSDPNRLSEYRVPQWESEVLFLQVLIEGDATLFLFKDGKMVKYFYSIDGIIPKQLVYKRYFKEDRVTTAVNKRYQNQLWTELRLPNATMSSVTNVSYKITSLSNYFKKYNGQSNKGFVEHKNSIKGDGAKFNLKVQAGISNPELTISNSRTGKSISYGSDMDYRFGMEIEMMLPFNKSKWAFYIDPSFVKYNSEAKVYDYYGEPEYLEAKFTSFKVSFGLRYYLYLNPKSRLYVGISVPYHQNFNTLLEVFYDDELDVTERSLTFIGVGVGYSYERFNLQFRRDPERSILKASGFWGEEMQDYSLTLSYQLLGSKTKEL
jgi:hypothetical protein